MSSPNKQNTEYAGEPGCKTLEEIHKAFRHFWDPTGYWECKAQGQRAKLKRCPQSQLFSGSKGKCVHYTEWEWSEPEDPPSKP
uniref:Chitin-binding type-2 domain-containing protein n=1 Tax=Stomoxys calcitrans TaxID=35570 RepID=A0A1I8NPM1_STOCA